MRADSKAQQTEDLLGHVEPDTSRRLLAAGLESFAQRGFHATTTRDISLGAGMSSAALYVYYVSKEELLFHLSQIAHESAFQTVAVESARHDEPVSRTRAIVEAFTTWHARHVRLARVAQYELAALSEEHLKEITELRRNTERIVREAIEAGAQDGSFDVQDVPDVTRAIMSLGIDVARWFQPGARIAPEDLAHTYGDLALRMLGASTAQPSRTRRPRRRSASSTSS